MEHYLFNQIPQAYESLVQNNRHVFGSLADAIELEIYGPKEEVIRFNRPITRLRYLIQGKAKITLVHENGNQSIVHFVKPHEYIGELTFLDIEKQHKNITTLCDCLFLAVPMTLAKDVLQSEAAFLYRLSQMVGEKMLYRTYFASKNQNYELKNRFAAYILMSEHQGVYSEKHTETAEYLGVSYRHLLFTLKGFVDDGLVKKIKGGYWIDSDGLQALAKDIELV